MAILVLPSSALQMGVQGGDMQSMHGSGGGGAGGTIVQYATQNQDGQFFVPGKKLNDSHSLQLKTK